MEKKWILAEADAAADAALAARLGVPPLVAGLLRRRHIVGTEEATLKKVSISPEGITLIGYNTLVYEPHFYSNKEIEQLPIRTLGEVVELRRKV